MKNKSYLIVALATILTILTIFIVRAQDRESLKEGKLLDRAIAAIERNYMDPSRIDPKKMLKGSLDQIQSSVPEILVKNMDSPVITVTVGLAEKQFHTGTLGTLSDLNTVMHDILPFIAANYHGEMKPEEIEYAAIDGMLVALDPHSNFMSPKVYKEFQVGTRGKFGGLGIVISIKDGQLTVVAPIEGTPASRAGIRSGDHILQIDDESTINMSLTDAVNKLRGDVNSKVSIIIEQAGKSPKKITLTRAIINIDSVQHRLLTEAGKRIGYIKVKNFQANTDDDVGAALADFHKDNAKLDGLILDLRNNPGGLLNISVDLADHFLKEGVIVSTVGPRDQVLEKEVARQEGSEPLYPIVVLVNEGSASASEIVAGALQANGRAVVMGRRSFGKGSVQTVFDLGNGAALKLTIAQYKPAGTQTIQLVGMTPDIELMPVTVDRKQMNLVEDEIPSEQDLEQHLDAGLAAKVEGGERSTYYVRYLKPMESEKELEAKSVREYANGPELQTDFAVQLAKRLFTTATAATRPELLTQVASTIKAADLEQDKLIDAALKKLNINWTIAKAQGEPRLKLAYHLRSAKGEQPRARAGEKITLELSATNTGTGPYSRLIGVGQSEMPFLSNREFVFGLVEAGATRSSTVEIDLPEGLSKRDMVMDVTFETSGAKAPLPLNVIVPVDEIPQPSFAFKYSLPPELRAKSLATGASVPMNVEITNVGNGPSSADTAVTLSNECGEKFFIEKGRTKIGAVPVKATRRTVFKFRLAADFSEPQCSVKLAVADTKRFIFLTDKIELLVKEGQTKPLGGVLYRAPVIEVAKAPTSTPDTSIKIAGEIRATDRVKDYFVFVGDKKIAYVPNPKENPSMTFELTVPLEPGPNQILVGARNEVDLMGRKIIVVNRTTGEKKKEKRFTTTRLPLNNE